jgi:hypothetical protein
MLTGSNDGRLVLLAGVDKRKLPGHAVIVGDPVAGGAYGNYTLDIFDSDPGRRIAALNVDCGMASLDCVAYITAGDSRWLAIALARDLSTAILFDFGLNRGIKR